MAKQDEPRRIVARGYDELEAGWLVCIIRARSFPTTEIEAIEKAGKLPTRTLELRGAA